MTFCLYCTDPMTAQRSTRQYCSEACKQRAKRVRRKQDANPLGCLICGNKVPVRNLGRRAVLTSDEILQVECPACSEPPGFLCSRSDLPPDLRPWTRKPFHQERVDEVRGWPSATGRLQAMRKYCGPECRAKARARQRAYRVAEQSSGSLSVSQAGSGTVVITLPERTTEAAFQRLLKVVRRPGKNTVVVRMPDPDAGDFEDDWKEITVSEASALTSRDGVFVALAVSGTEVSARKALHNRDISARDDVVLAEAHYDEQD